MPSIDSTDTRWTTTRFPQDQAERLLRLLFGDLTETVDADLQAGEAA